MKHTTLFFLLMMVMMACSTEETIIDEPTIDDPIIEEVGLNFGNLELGDITQFVLFQSDCEDMNETLQFTGDTLTWEVTQLDNGEAVLTETFTASSPLAKIEPFDNSIGYTSDYILMPNRWQSNLFFFYGKDTLRVDPAPTVELTQQGCNFMLGDNLFTGDEIALINEAKVGTYTYSDMTVVSCVPGSVLDGYIVYKEGAISAIFSREFLSGTVRGWIAIE